MARFQTRQIPVEAFMAGGDDLPEELTRILKERGKFDSETHRFYYDHPQDGLIVLDEEDMIILRDGDPLEEFSVMPIDVFTSIYERAKERADYPQVAAGPELFNQLQNNFNPQPQNNIVPQNLQRFMEDEMDRAAAHENLRRFLRGVRGDHGEPQENR